MAGSCWRLLAVLSLIFVASTFLRGQDATSERATVGSADARTVAPVSGADVPRWVHPLPISPIWIPPLSLPGPYPIAAGTTGLQPRVFQQLVRSAGIIFSGRVSFVGHGDARGVSSLRPGTTSTTVTFQVEQAMRGAAAGQNVTIHEWAGLWARGERYRVGDHVLLFLYSPSKLGLTSPVAGALGRFALDSQGRIVISAQQMAALAGSSILGGKPVVPYADFALAVRGARQEGTIEP